MGKGNGCGGRPVRFELSASQRVLQDEIRSLTGDLMTDALREEMRHSHGGGPEWTKALKTLAKGSWLGLGWPAEYGGGGRGPLDEYLFFDELARVGYPLPLLTLNTVGPTLIAAGNEAQKQYFLPKILAGDCQFSIGYTEPAAGTDLASLQTRAVRDGDEYVINGQKIWNSLGDFADYIWLAARTDPDAKRHEGISMLIVPRETPGVSLTPMRALGDNNVHAVYFENVRIPAANLVGPENSGWGLITSQLNHERVALVAAGPGIRLLDQVRNWVNGQPHGKEAWVQRNLDEVDARLETLRLLNWQQAWAMERGSLNPADASAIKVYGSEAFVQCNRLLMEIVGVGGILKDGPASFLRGELERFYRSILVLTFGGGTNEVQRDIIAMAGLRMPRGRR
jgi:3-oxocholest-4-en-26-oyl-CoA dehydrogenase alpha subunit